MTIGSLPDGRHLLGSFAKQGLYRKANFCDEGKRDAVCFGV